MKKKLTLVLVAVFFLLTLPAFAQKKSAVQSSKKINSNKAAVVNEGNIKKAAGTNFQYFVIRSDSSTYGYRIYSNGQLYIEQTTIPALPGNRGFAIPADAEKAARLVIQKIKKGEIPPTISIAELKKLNIN